MRKKAGDTWKKKELALLVRAHELDLAAEEAMGPVARAEFSARSSDRGALDRPGRILAAAAAALARGENSSPVTDLVRQADLSRWEVVVGNERFVKYIVSRSGSKRRAPHLEEDAMQVARLALFEAARRFQVSRGFSFRTYATWWLLSRSMDLVTAQSYLLYLPKETRSRKVTLSSAQTYLRSKLGREPTRREVAEFCGVSSEDVAAMAALENRPASFDEPENPERSDEPLSSLVAAPEPGGLLSHDASAVHAAIGRLRREEADVVRLLFGIGSPDGEGTSAAAAATRLGRSRQRVAQLRDSALVDLATSLRSRERVRD